ncbi:MAG: MBL fold metallo-hydrolase, partial [Alphaproteobacteria bacterium]|nr:MBL fold metallo-hydrolase [Alphaproteobacteria bacterium]
MKLDGHDLDILVQGYPGKAVCHGGLGWSTIVTIRHGGRLVMVDCGSFGMRRTLQARLKERGLVPADVSDLLLTHSHYDHSVNWTLFRHARIVIGALEMDWALNEPWGESVVPELYVRELKNWPTAVQVREGDEIFPGVTAYDAPGHTPGHLIFVLRGREHDVIFTGD